MSNLVSTEIILLHPVGCCTVAAEDNLYLQNATFRSAPGGLEVPSAAFWPVPVCPVIYVICRIFTRYERSIRPPRTGLYWPGCSTVAVHPAALRENGAALVGLQVGADVSREETHAAVEHRRRGG